MRMRDLWSRRSVLAACALFILGGCLAASATARSRSRSGVSRAVVQRSGPRLRRLPRVDRGHESLQVAQELQSDARAPGPHVDAAGGRGGAGPAAVPAGRLISGLSTAYSNTWQRPGDPHVTRIYAAPVNYRDVQGAWKAISNQLAPSSAGGYVNRANAFVLRVPSALTRPVSLTEHGFTIRFALRGAHGAGRVAGASAVFAGALRAADVVYRSVSSGVLETVTLKRPHGPVEAAVCHLGQSRPAGQAPSDRRDRAA
jgi:hypothetical protein